MEFVTNRIGGKAKRVWKDGKAWLVADATLIPRMPCVLKGSKGEVRYRSEVVGPKAAHWNGMPITNGHPVHDGEAVSASTSGVHRIGHMADVIVNGSLKGKAWFDVEECDKSDKRIAENLRAGKAFDLSTGMHGTLVENGALLDLEDFTPDHVAVLLDQRGACSRNDGCGILVNEDGSFKLVDNQQPSDSVDLTPEKACEILKDGEVRGHPLTEAQKGMFGAICGQRSEFRGSAARAKKLKPGNRIRYKGKSYTIKSVKDGVITFEGGGSVSINNYEGSIMDHVAAVHAAFRKAFPNKYDPDTGMLQKSCYIEDIFDGYLVYRENGELYRVDFDESYTFGEPVEVVRRTEYVEVANQYTLDELISKADAELGSSSRVAPLLNTAMEAMGKYNAYIEEAVQEAPEDFRPLLNIFCRTGPGGGVDPRCKRFELSMDLVEIAEEEGDYPEAVAKLKSALSALQSEDNSDNREAVAGAHQRLAVRYRMSGRDILADDHVKAAKRYRSAVRNQEADMPKLTPEQRTATVNNLIANCSCPVETPWKGKSAEELSTLSDDTLAAYDETRKSLLTLNRKPRTFEEWMKDAPPEAAAVWNVVQEEASRQKQAIIDQLVVNISGEARDRAVQRFQTMDIPALRDLLVLVPPPPVQSVQPTSPVLNFAGANPAPPQGAGSQAPLPSPTYTYQKR